MFIRVLRPLLLLLGGLVLEGAGCARAHGISSSSEFDASIDDSASEASIPGDNDGALEGDGGGGGLVLPDGPAPSDAPAPCTSDACPSLCGNGTIDPGETCDDGNSTPGDGCSDNCQIEPGYVCSTAGQPCLRVWICGNGKLDPGESCDDGNLVAGDGCSSTCQLEPGWQCPNPGATCVANSVCGDGLLAGTEQCDDGNTAAGDGCSATCQIEPGYACATSTTPPPASTCHKTVCGDRKKEGSEQCDDGNVIPYDGCSPTCTIEPNCNGMGGCSGVCGDGLVFPGEQCDDGNTISGDGCSSTCQIEPGFACTKVTQPAAATLDIPILYRDMLYFDTIAPNFPLPQPAGGGHPDFNRASGAVTGLVQATLGADHEPVWQSNGPAGNPLLTGAVDYCWWYHETGCGDGGANPYDKLVYLDALGKPTTLTLTQGASGTYTYNNPQFFPLDGLGWNAGTNPQVGTDCEPGLTNGLHNFSFTSELHYIFTYQASAVPPVFNFTGDDDVWGFINNQLVIDLGGVHNPLSRAYTLNPAMLGLTDGGWYSIDLFQAERHVCRSTYALTLGGFVHTISQCHSTCGDGVVAGGEKCDNGANNVAAATAYGPGICATDCTPAPNCGDGVVQMQFGEQCDNSTNLATYGGTNPMVCGPGCKWAPYCGDGIVQAQFGEQCDGTSNCNATCLKAGAK